MMCYAHFSILTQNIMKQLVAAANEMHSKGIFHRDLKLENLLLDTSSNSPRVRIIDFGCACIVSRKPYTTFYGTTSGLCSNFTSMC